MTKTMINGQRSTEAKTVLTRRENNKSLVTGPRAPRAVIYARVIYARVASTVRADEAAIEQQLDECRAMAKRLGCDVVNVFEDVGVAGIPLDRPGLAALFGYVAANSVDFMICADTDRLAKNSSLLLHAVLCLDAHGTRTAFARTNTLMEVHYDKEEASNAG